MTDDIPDTVSNPKQIARETVRRRGSIPKADLVTVVAIICDCQEYEAAAAVTDLERQGEIYLVDHADETEVRRP